ncbi:MAG: hypothetical protein R3Y13_02835 [bacterium]
MNENQDILNVSEQKDNLFEKKKNNKIANFIFFSKLVLIFIILLLSGEGIEKITDSITFNINFLNPIVYIFIGLLFCIYIDMIYKYIKIKSKWLKTVHWPLIYSIFATFVMLVSYYLDVQQKLSGYESESSAGWLIIFFMFGSSIAITGLFILGFICDICTLKKEYKILDISNFKEESKKIIILLIVIIIFLLLTI